MFIQNIHFVLHYTRDAPKFKFLAEAEQNETWKLLCILSDIIPTKHNLL